MSRCESMQEGNIQTKIQSALVVIAVLCVPVRLRVSALAF